MGGTEGEAAEVYVETVYMAAEPEERLLQRVLLDESSQITTAAAKLAGLIHSLFQTLDEPLT